MTAGASRSSTSSSPTRSTASRSVSAGASQRPLEDLRDVLPAEVLAVLRLRRVVEHDEAVRARRGDGLRPRRHGVGEPPGVHLLPDPPPPPPPPPPPAPARPRTDPLCPAPGPSRRPPPPE